ncbi:hypothetical protein [Sorangium sp. So ce388]|uniref:hypothetical protein n=1 Tax=Sorangium sp. So ce388 TaxID=3133309 RepID=UPI003F5B32F0
MIKMTRQNLRTYFTSLWTATFYHAIRKSNWLAIGVSGAFSLIIFVAAEISPERGVWGISKASWLSVCGGVFASFLFLCIQSALIALSTTNRDVYRAAFDDLVEKHGVKAVFSQRGSDDIKALYKKLLAAPHHRVWAIGMTNKHFVEQHLASLVDTLRKYEIDLVIAFWDPATTLTVKQNGGRSRSIIEAQAALEGSPGSRWDEVISKRQRRIVDAVNGQPIRGEIRIVNISSVTSFSCFVIDDDVFFFPFLAHADSTNDPTIHCAAEGSIGNSIIEHFTKLLRHSDVCATAYRQKGSDVLVDLK